MPTSYSDRLADYVDVKTRVAEFYAKHPEGRLTTAEAYISEDPDGKVRVWCHAKAYRTPDDPLPGDGWSYLEVPGSTPYTRGSEIENAETSAWGRAIGSLGILIDRSIASAQEVENKKGEAPKDANGAAPPHIEPNVETEELVGDIKRAGTVRPGSANGYKLEPRQGPNGHVIGFRLEIDGDKAIPQVVVEGPPGEALFLATSQNPETLAGHHISVKGRLYHVKRPGKASYYRLHVSEWATTDYKFPAEDEPALPEPPDDVPLIAEAPTAPLFDDVAVA
jgi:hypothetical protein